MRAEIIARNYAETLLELARRQGAGARWRSTAPPWRSWPALVADAAGARVPVARPRMHAAERKEALRGALEGRVPELFLRFVMVVVDKRRQPLLAEIAHEYRALVDEQAGRVRVQRGHQPRARRGAAERDRPTRWPRAWGRT